MKVPCVKRRVCFFFLSLANATAIAWPIPLAPPWTRNVSPYVSRPRSKTLVQTVQYASGSAAAEMTIEGVLQPDRLRDFLYRRSKAEEEEEERVEDEVDVGDEVTVMITEVDRMGRINLSRRAASQGLHSEGDGAPSAPARPSSSDDGGPRNGPPRDRGPGPRPGGRGPAPRPPRRY